MSRLEDLVVNFVYAKYPEISIWRNARVIKKTKKSRYEIDIYLTDLSLGFEVQDFATHSRNSDTEEGNPWKKYKKGPKLHELKKALALEQLNVVIVELWQDEIEDGSFREKVINEIDKRLT